MIFRKIIAIVVSIVLAAQVAATLCVFGEEKAQTEKSYKTTGQYYYNITFGVGGKTPDGFVFDEECFRESSFKACPHIALLSTQLAKTSTPYCGESGYDEDFSHASKYIEGFMKGMGFRNVAVNKYYNMNCLENSIGIAVGSRKIQVLDKEYTLVVLAPRSDGYNQEWCGNFMVGDGDMHQGFKDVRDEALRFLKKYIEDNNISGSVKIWLAGHSRGAAVANMVGGFLAGGGAGYLGSSVSLSPEDIYCYTTGTPRSIKDGVAKSEELSVSGPREGMYENDTEGEPFLYCGTGNLDLSDPVYGGIRCYSIGYDVITFLLPKQWGFRCYGRACSVDGSGDTYGDAGKQVQEEDIIPFVERISDVAYNGYIAKRKCDFQWMTLDMSKLKMVRTVGPEGVTAEDFLGQRIAGLIANIPTNEDYVKGGYQDALMSLGGAVGMLALVFINGEGLELTDAGTISLIVRLFSAYMSERTAAEKAAGDGPAGVDPTIVNEPVNKALRERLNAILVNAAWKARPIYGKTYFEQLNKHIENLNNYSNQLRQIFSYTFFYTEGEKYSKESALRSAMTIADNLSIYTAPHYCEIYLAWAKLVDKSCTFEHHTGQAEYDEEQERKREHEKEQKIRKSQKFTVTVSGGTVKQASVKKKAVTAAVIKVKKSYGKLTFSKISGSKKLTVNNKGEITLKRGARKGKYKMKVRITAAGNSKYKPAAKNVSIVIRVN